MRYRLMAAAAFIPVLAACGGSSSGGGSTVDSFSNGGNPAAGGGVSAATCIAPTLTLKPAKAAPGDEVKVSGEWFVDGCNDTGMGEAPKALTGMTLEVIQGHESWPVASGVDATGENSSFEVSIEVPADAQAGKATVQATDYGLPADLEITD